MICRRTPEGRERLKKVLGVTSTYRIQKGSFQRKFIAACTSDECSLYAHCIKVQSDNIIFRFDEFQDKTCFEIAHSPEAENLWTCNGYHKVFLNQMGREKMNNDLKNSDKDSDDERKPKIPRAYSIRTSHPLYIRLREAYGLSPVSRVKSRGKPTGQSDIEGSGESDGDEYE